MVIDCDACAMRDLACGDCVVAFLARPAGDGRGVTSPAGGVDLDESESRAFAVLATSGLVPPLRMTRRPAGRTG